MFPLTQPLQFLSLWDPLRSSYPPPLMNVGESAESVVLKSLVGKIGCVLCFESPGNILLFNQLRNVLSY